VGDLGLVREPLRDVALDEVDVAGIVSRYCSTGGEPYGLERSNSSKGEYSTENATRTSPARSCGIVTRGPDSNDA
jgi:hypothetical protein